MDARPWTLLTAEYPPSYGKCFSDIRLFSDIKEISLLSFTSERSISPIIYAFLASSLLPVNPGHTSQNTYIAPDYSRFAREIS